MALLAAFACACRAPDDALHRIETEGFARAGYAQEAPYSFVDETGHVTGESPEALRAAFGAIGIDSIQWSLVDFDDLIPALREGRVDAIASGMFVTEERRKLVGFTRPTLCARPALVRRASSPSPAGLTAFAGAGELRLAVIEGAVEKAAAELLEVPAARLVVVPDLATGVSAVRSGAADALALSAPTVRRAVESGGDLAWEAYDPPTEVAALVAGCSAIAFRPADARLRLAVDSALSAYVGSAAHVAVLGRLGLTPADVRVPPDTESGRGG